MTIKEARKIIADAGFSFRKDGNDILLWGYSPQGVPASYLCFRADNERLRKIAAACQMPTKIENYRPPYVRQREIRNIERTISNGNANTL